jgi:REP element-mobilizing transposase RayT
MRRARWIIPPRLESPKPVIYHCISRAVNREFVFGDLEREQQRMFMRMYENFSGCRVLAYCFMSNHFHILLEVTPMAACGLSDDELLKRLHAIHHEAQVEEVAVELEEARKKIRAGMAEISLAERIHERFTYRMHDLSEFMKGFMQRYTQWHNRIHQRTGRLWEHRFKSVIVEDGVACKTMAAYIDLNPVRAGMVKDPADYRWSSYGEAIGGGAKGNGKKARGGLVRAMRAHQGVTADADLWPHDVSREYRKILLAGAVEREETRVGRSGETAVQRTRKGMSAEDVKQEQEGEQACSDRRLGEIPFGKMLRCRVRYFTDGAVIGSREFVNEAFAGARERFGSRRKDGARKMRGSGAAAAGMLWSARDLHQGIG